MLQLYGPGTSRVLMCAWVLDELGIEFEQVEITREQAREPDFLAINPNGKVPALVDGDIRLFESMAISLYLARTYGAQRLWPDSRAEQAQATQWAFWAATELEPPLVNFFGQTLFTPPSERDPAQLEQAVQQAGRPLRVLERHLQGRSAVNGAAFSVSDINLASVLAPAHYLAKLDLQDYPAVRSWYDGCMQRAGCRRMNESLAAFAAKLEQGFPFNEPAREP